MILRPRAVLLLLTALAACVSGGQSLRYARAEDYSLDIRPDAATGAFLLSLTSRSSRTLCVPQHSWPNRLGQLHMGAGQAQVVIDDRTYPATDTNFGYCIGAGCTLRIEPRGSLRGRIAFSEFRGWDAATVERARLRFSVRPAACR